MSAIVWKFSTFFGIAFLWDWNENWPFSSSVELNPLLSIYNAYALYTKGNQTFSVYRMLSISAIFHDTPGPTMLLKYLTVLLFQ